MIFGSANNLSLIENGGMRTEARSGESVLSGEQSRVIMHQHSANDVVYGVGLSLIRFVASFGGVVSQGNSLLKGKAVRSLLHVPAREQTTLFPCKHHITAPKRQGDSGQQPRKMKPEVSRLLYPSSLPAFSRRRYESFASSTWL